MSSKSQRKKELVAQRRNEKRKRQEQKKKRLEARGRQVAGRTQTPVASRPAEIPVVSNARLRQRLAEQIPQPWPGELAADVAVYDDAALQSLPTELIPQATAVREALREAAAARRENALKLMSEIPRGSPFSEWRLFIRGLVDWLAYQYDSAAEAWKRLDLERRPARIARVMLLALRTDLEQLGTSPAPLAPTAAPAPPAASSGTVSPSDVPQSNAPQSNAPQQLGAAELGDGASDGTSSPMEKSLHFEWNATQIHLAQLVRRMRFDRPALRMVEAALKSPDYDPNLKFCSRKLHWLWRFVAEYKDTEPELTAALSQTALSRIYTQNYGNIFEQAAAQLPGPRHDPRNRLLSYMYYSRFAKDQSAVERSTRALNEYLEKDLPNNEALPKSLRGAIASKIHLYEATDLMNPEAGLDMLSRLLGEPREDTKAIRAHLQAAIDVAPDHRAAYTSYAEWIKSNQDDSRLSKHETERFEAELAQVMSKWAKGLPDDAEPRLWLVDYLLENEQLEEARPHVEFLAASRQEHPRVRATPWKWQMLEAMRMCRRKAWLGQASARLDEAEKLWPTWLSKQWLPYFHAALSLRMGQGEALESARERLCIQSGRVRDSLADSCMMLGAAQLMRATSEELKPLRAALDRALKQLDSLPLADLIETASFFWDMHRMGVTYPANRMHAKTIGLPLSRRLAMEGTSIAAGIEDRALQQALLWGSQWRYWSNIYETKFPPFFSDPSLREHPFIVAAKVNAIVRERHHWTIEKHLQLGTPLRAAAAESTDIYYRHWFKELADQFDEVIAQKSRRFSSFPFDDIFGAFASDIENDDLDENDD